MGDRYGNQSYRPRTAGRNCGLDSKEILKSEMQNQLQQPDGVGYIPPGLAPVNVGFVDYQLYFDSLYRDRSSDYSVGEIRWPIANLNNNLPLVNTVQVYLTPFFFPKIYAPADRPEYLYFCRIFMEIQSLPSIGAVQGPNGGKFHFEFAVRNLSGQAIELIPLQKSFYLPRPLSSFDNFNVCFKIPHTTLPSSTMKRIPLPHEIVKIRSAMDAEVGYTPIRFTILAPDDSTVLGRIGSLGAPGVAVFITGFNSNSPAINTAINNPNGIYATAVNDSNNFEIAEVNGFDLDMPYDATMYIPKNRIAFTARFTSVCAQPTNYIDAIHD